ncbi:MAG: tetratricopeptide repeat protein [Gemmataceae bacterium]
MMKEDCKSLCRRAKLAFARGEHAEARDIYVQALELEPGSADAHYGLAATAYLLKDLREAAIHFQETIKLDPKRVGAYINLGAIMNRYERYGDAMRLLKRGLALDTKRVEGYCNLGLAYRKTNQVDKAIKCYREAARLKPELVDAQYNLGRLYLQLQDYAQAVERFETVLQLKPDLEAARQALADAQAQLAGPAVETATEQLVPGSLEQEEPGLIPFDSAEQPAPTETTQEEEEAGEATTEEEGEARSALGDTASDTEGGPPTVAEMQLDPERKLDPDLHRDDLTIVYQLAKETEADGRRLLDLFEDETSPVLKELGACLTHSRMLGINEREDNTEKFAEVVEKIRALHADIQDKIHRMHEAGERVLRS